MRTSAHGTYLLLLECDRSIELTVGRLGGLMTAPGYYLYVGSAFGPGGVRARIDHHSRAAARPHWHIDYLRSAADLAAAWCSYDVRAEHRWARALLQSDDLAVPMKRFGASDCDCTAHLFWMEQRPKQTFLEKVLDTELAVVDFFSR